MGQALAQITPAQRLVAVPPSAVTPRRLSNREKAAVIVQFLLAEGAALPLAGLPEEMQADLTEQMGRMRLVDRSTLDAVVAEFLSELEQVGLAFPGGIDKALTLMDGHISPGTASRLRRLAGARGHGDPWDRITGLPSERLLAVLEQESAEVAAVMLSKLPVPKAADLLGRLPGDKARRVAYAVSLTGNVAPDTVRRIGMSLAQQLDSQPVRAFDTGPVERVGAILNVAPAVMRDDVLQGLEETDAVFAGQVRRAIFTFAHIPARLAARDVPKVVRIVDQQVMVSALAAAEARIPDSAAFILANMSQRLAQALRDDMATRGELRDKDAEAAMAEVVSAIRQLEAAGELVLAMAEE